MLRVREKHLEESNSLIFVRTQIHMYAHNYTRIHRNVHFCRLWYYVFLSANTNVFNYMATYTYTHIIVWGEEHDVLYWVKCRTQQALKWVKRSGSFDSERQVVPLLNRGKFKSVLSIVGPYFWEYKIILFRKSGVIGVSQITSTYYIQEVLVVEQAVSHNTYSISYKPI